VNGICIISTISCKYLYYGIRGLSESWLKAEK
jgi:hypothetical protein